MRSIGSDFLGTCLWSLLVLLLVVVCLGLGGWKEGSCLERRLRSDEVGLDLGCLILIGGGAAGGGGRFLFLFLLVLLLVILLLLVVVVILLACC